MEKETIEEAAKRIYPINILVDYDTNEDIRNIWIEGAKWQAERMYSEEDLREAFRQGQDNMDYSEIYGWDSKLTEQEWFEQFKKK